MEHDFSKYPMLLQDSGACTPGADHFCYLERNEVVKLKVEQVNQENENIKSKIMLEPEDEYELDILKFMKKEPWVFEKSRRNVLSWEF